MKKIYFLLCAFLCLGFISIQAQVSVVVPFSGTSGAYPGANPYGTLTRSGNILYGMAYDGGANNDGCVFAVDTNGNNYRDLLDFDGTNGWYPRGSLLLSGGFLYGMTTLGGANHDGVVFRVDTGGNNYKDLLDFDGTNGTTPWGSLILLGGNLYGMTQGGGIGEGVIFSVDTNGNNDNIILNLGDSDVISHGPEGDLIFVNGKFYGMTESGGANSGGTIFSVDTNGQNYKDLVDFNGSTYPQGQYPKGSLTYSAGKLYGMAEQGGPDDLGVVFVVDTDGTGYNVLLNFTNANGNDPTGNLLLIGGTLYGTTDAGGTHSAGNIFSIDTSGQNYADLVDFDGTDGSFPAGTLTFANGALYGTTYQGGSFGNYGNVFSTNICNLTVSLDSGVFAVPCYGVSTGSAIAAISRGTPPYTFQWTQNVSNGDTAINLGAGTYTVSVTDNNQCSGTASVTIAQPNAISVAIATVNEPCFGDSVGTALAIPSGGRPPYQLEWIGGAELDGDTAVSLAAQTYTLQVFDSSGCSIKDTVTITQPTVLSLAGDSVNTTDSCNGIAAVISSGGTPPYNYLWQDGLTTDTITHRCPSTYCCSVTDSNGCQQNICVTVNMSTGINNLSSLSNIHIYPEPNNGKFTINGLTAGQVIELFDYNGQQLSSFVAVNTTARFDITDKANGIYLIRVLSKDGNLVGETQVVKTQ